MTIYSVFPLKMVIFHSYVSLPDGISFTNLHGSCLNRRFRFFHVASPGRYKTEALSMEEGTKGQFWRLGVIAHFTAERRNGGRQGGLLTMIS